MRNEKIKVFFTPAQVMPAIEGFSQSPRKPALLMEQLHKLGLSKYLEIDGTFSPFEKDEFLLAHTDKYVRSFFNGKKPMCELSDLPWSEKLADTVRYTNASLYSAIREAVLHPETVCFSPTSGFHHAQPKGGLGFCTFSGQVIASTKIYRELGLAGAYVDLDGHFGNSIGDSDWFVDDLQIAIPFNINPEGGHAYYIKNLESHLELLRKAILGGTVHYVVFCHGADSHEWDEAGGGKLTTAEWAMCSQMFYKWVKKVSEELGKPLPVVMSLFGGYRSDNYESVLNMHTYDLVTCHNILIKDDISAELNDGPPARPHPHVLLKLVPKEAPVSA